ncbi:MAG: acetyl-CoA carboxylase biotin carboxyl carrier protein subunit [Candidatus Marinimicrobia bacterium]|nr:acetyl-CoA carboxylase biotin carboxyl carrier protein subunit [Candidatus Neomarinimicrobiota bacterium]
MKFQAIIDESIIDISIINQSSSLEIICNNESIEMDCQPLSPHSYSLILNGKSHFLSIRSHPEGYEVTIDQHTNIVTIKDEQQLLLEKFGFSSSEKIQTGEIIAQIPGLISQIFVEVGDKVEAGNKLFILEAMKMENEIDSPIPGTVKSISIESGVAVEKGALIMEIEE